MGNRIWLAVLLMLAVIAAACGGGEGEAPRSAAAVTETSQVIDNTIAPSPTMSGEAPTGEPATSPTTETFAPVEELTETPPAPASADASASADAEASGASSIYTADGNPCLRDVFMPPIPTAGGVGQEVMRFDIVAGEDSPLVLNKLPQDSIVDGVYFAGPEGQLLVTHSWREGIRVWDTGSEDAAVQLDGDRRLWLPAVSREAGLLAAADNRGQIWLWDLDELASDNGRMLLDLGTDDFGVPRVREIALSADGRLLAVAENRAISQGDLTISEWGVTRIFDTASGEALARMEGEMISKAQIPQELDEGDPDFYELSEAIVPAVMQNGHAGPIDWLAFSPDSRFLFSGNLDNEASYSPVEIHGTEGTIRIWDVATGAHVRCIETGDLNDGTDPALSPDGRELAMADGESIVIWDATTSEQSRRFTLPEALNLELDALVYSPDGRSLIAAAGQEKTARIWDSATGLLTGLLRHPDDVQAVAVSQDGARIAAGIGSRSAFDGTEAGATWIWNAHHPAIRSAAQAQALVEVGLAAAGRGELQEALAAFDEAHDLAADDEALLRPAILEKACRQGSLAGSAAEALAVCEQALSEARAAGYDDLNLAQYTDSRGLARALTGDFEGAIADFEFYVSQFDTGDFWVPYDVRRRQDWIAALRSGFDPFDEFTLRSLEDE